MDCLIGLRFKDYVLVASDRKEASSIMVLKGDSDKVHKLSSHLIMAVSGEAGDTTQFAEYIAKNVQLYKMQNGYELPPSAAAHFTRSTLATHLRSREPYTVNLLIGGFDPEENESHLFYMDYLAASIPVDHYAFGYGGMFTLSIMDKEHDINAPVEEGYKLLTQCVDEIKRRFIVNMAKFKVYCISAKGVQEMEDIIAKGEVI